MILQYYGINTSLREMKRTLKLRKEVGTYIPQIGLLFMKKGFDTEIVIQNPFILTTKSRQMSPKQILKQIKEIYSKDKRKKKRSRSRLDSLEYFIKYLEAGGKIRVKVPGEEDIKTEARAGRPLIAGMTNWFMLSGEPHFNGHFVVVRGIDKKYVYVNDPINEPDADVKSRYPIEDFLFGVHANSHGDPDNGSFLLIRKRKTA